MQVELPIPNRQQVWLPVKAVMSGGSQYVAGYSPEHLLPSDIADVIAEVVQVVEQLGNEPKSISRSLHSQNLVYRQNDVVLEEGATFAIGLPPSVAICSVRMAPCRRLHKEPGV